LLPLLLRILLLKLVHAILLLKLVHAILLLKLVHALFVLASSTLSSRRFGTLGGLGMAPESPRVIYGCRSSPSRDVETKVDPL
jgi:hypothetical protein